MKFPRWLVLSLLSVSLLAVFGVGGWWWITWPEQTARTLVELMAEDQLLDVLSRMRNPHEDIPFLLGELGGQAWKQQNLRMEPRTVADLVCGRQRFKVLVVVIATGEKVELTHSFTAQRGSILDGKTDIVMIDESDSPTAGT
jgi:hypothetical protein